MATITTGGSGNWSSTTPNAPWPGGTLPTSADDVVIAKNHIVTLDIATAVCKSLTANLGTTGSDAGGKLTCSTSANTKLIVEQGMTFNGSNSGATYGQYSSIIELDVSGSAYTCEIYINNAALNTAAASIIIGGKCRLKGAIKNRWTLTKAPIIGGATSVEVEDATGWVVGDKLIFATTQAYNATPKISEVIISSITPTVAPAATVGLSATQNSHDTKCLVGNFSSNLILGPNVANIAFALRLDAIGNRDPSGMVRDVLFKSCGANGTFGYGGVLSLNSSIYNIDVTRCIFYDFGGIAHSHYAIYGNTPFSDNQYYTTRTGTTLSMYTTQIGSAGDETNPCVYRCERGFALVNSGMKIINPMMSGLTHSAITGGSYGDAEIVGGGIWSSYSVGYFSSGVNAPVLFNSTYLGKGFSGSIYPNANNANIVRVAGPGSFNFISCLENLTGGARFDVTGGSDASEAGFYNRNGDAANQDIYRQSFSITSPIFSRDVVTTKRSPSSLKIATLGKSVTFSRSFPVLVNAGKALTILLYAYKNAAFNDSTNIRPTATLSGLGITPITATMSDVDDTWELLTLSYNSAASPSSDGELTLTLSCMSAAATAVAYFSGVPIVPFVTRCRHYGYIFDEANKTRTINPVTVSDEATAAAYTGVTINSVTPQITVGAGTANTFQKVYDYIQAWGCQNVDKDVLFTSTDKINFQVPLTCKVSWPAMGADGVLSGGWLLLTAGTHTYKLSGTKIDCTTAGAYHFEGTVFSGTVELVNSSGGIVDVYLPIGASYTNSGPDITVHNPEIISPISITGMVEGSVLAVFKNSDGSAIVSPTTIDSSGAYSTTITYPGSDIPVTVVVRKGTSGQKYLPFSTLGVITSSGLNVIVSQIPDGVLNG